MNCIREESSESGPCITYGIRKGQKQIHPSRQRRDQLLKRCYGSVSLAERYRQPAIRRINSSYLHANVRLASGTEAEHRNDAAHVSSVTALLGTVLIRFTERPLYSPLHPSSRMIFLHVRTSPRYDAGCRALWLVNGWSCPLEARCRCSSRYRR